MRKLSDMICLRSWGGVFAACISIIYSCSGEDRSGEMPRIPVVYTTSVVVSGDACTMNGLVAESHNSTLRECGFVYGMAGENPLQLKTDTARAFMAKVDSLENGDYFCVAYAKNGMGLSYGDTLRFVVK